MINKEKIIAIFDIGKSNKKVLLFDYNLKIVSETEKAFPEIKDEDGFECDDIELIENWFLNTIQKVAHSDQYELTAVNFTTYGASLVYLDKDGKRLTPLYNYLKPISKEIPEQIYRKYGGRDEFCRATSSPYMGMLNSGFQILWLKTVKPEVFSKVKYILHFPQYLSFLLTGKIHSEHTSIGCHTALWDFDKMCYHRWVKDEGLNLTEPEDLGTLHEIEIYGKKIKVGIGIHDSSASLVPYFSDSLGNFILVSTGTWCILMNPFNGEPLTTEQLSKGCHCYMSINRQPVKSSQLLLGPIHEAGIDRLIKHFIVPRDSYKYVTTDTKTLYALKKKLMGRRVFLKSEAGINELQEEIDFSIFKSFSHGYHQLMTELCDLTKEAIDLVIPSKDESENIYIIGGFAKNVLFLNILASAFPEKRILSAEIDNASALGAALVIRNSLNMEKAFTCKLGLKSWKL